MTTKTSEKLDLDAIIALCDDDPSSETNNIVALDALLAELDPKLPADYTPRKRGGNVNARRGKRGNER